MWGNSTERLYVRDGLLWNFCLCCPSSYNQDQEMDLHLRTSILWQLDNFLYRSWICGSICYPGLCSILLWNTILPWLYISSGPLYGLLKIINRMIVIHWRKACFVMCMLFFIATEAMEIQLHLLVLFSEPCFITACSRCYTVITIMAQLWAILFGTNHVQPLT